MIRCKLETNLASISSQTCKMALLMIANMIYWSQQILGSISRILRLYKIIISLFTQLESYQTYLQIAIMILLKIVINLKISLIWQIRRKDLSMVMQLTETSKRKVLDLGVKLRGWRISIKITNLIRIAFKSIIYWNLTKGHHKMTPICAANVEIMKVIFLA